MIEPFLKDDAFIEEVQRARLSSAFGEDLRLWWLGQSGFLLLWKSSALLVDPYLSDSLTHKYANTDKPHVRVTARVIDPHRLDFIDGVTSSHAHSDHLDGETLSPLLEANPEMVVIVPEANREFAAERLHVATARLNGITLGEVLQVGDFQIQAIPAAHEQVEIDSNGDHKYHGYIIKAGPWTVYHAGDCVLYEGLVDSLRSHQIDIALLPINGRVPQRGVAGNFSGKEAAELAYFSQSGLVIPMHYGMFQFNTVTPDEFVRTCQELRLAYRLLQNGEGTSFS